DKLSFPFYTVWEEPLCVDDMGDLVAIDGDLADRVADCDWRDAQEFYCEEMNDDWELFCDNGMLVDGYYPDCDDVPGGGGQDDDDDKKHDDDDDKPGGGGQDD